MLNLFEDYNLINTILFQNVNNYFNIAGYKDCETLEVIIINNTQYNYFWVFFLYLVIPLSSVNAYKYTSHIILSH